jgi:hypothetical protein
VAGKIGSTSRSGGILAPNGAVGFAVFGADRAERLRLAYEARGAAS